MTAVANNVRAHASTTQPAAAIGRQLLQGRLQKATPSTGEGRGGENFKFYVQMTSYSSQQRFLPIVTATNRKLINASTINRSKGLRHREAILLFDLAPTSNERSRETPQPTLWWAWQHATAGYDPVPTTMASSSESKETRALQQCSADLTNHLQHNILAVSSSLLAKGLITDELFQWVLTAQGVSALNKAARVVACISDRVRGSPESFDALLDVLKQDQYYADVVEKLTTLRDMMPIAQGWCSSVLKTKHYSRECDIHFWFT